MPAAPWALSCGHARGRRASLRLLPGPAMRLGLPAAAALLARCFAMQRTVTARRGAPRRARLAAARRSLRPALTPAQWLAGAALLALHAAVAWRAAAGLAAAGAPARRRGRAPPRRRARRREPAALAARVAGRVAARAAARLRKEQVKVSAQGELAWWRSCSIDIARESAYRPRGQHAQQELMLTCTAARAAYGTAS